MKYKTVVIDPPWPITEIGDCFLTNDIRVKKTSKYNLMSLNDIYEFPINDFADDALLFLWVVNSKIKNKAIIHIGFELIEKWGFTYHNIITWDKQNNYALWSPIKTQTEHCLFAYRGSFNELTQKQYGIMSNLLSTPRQNYHSQKPYEFYQRLRAWTPKPRIDIFARQVHYGFDGWGDEYVGEGPLQECLE